MAIGKPWDRSLYVLGGAVMKSGFSLSLADGVFGIFNMNQGTPKGTTAVSNFNGYNKKENSETYFEIKLGERIANFPGVGTGNDRNFSNKTFSTFPFRIKDVVDLKVSTPQRTEIAVDDLIIGYNGVDPTTSISLKPGEYREIYIELSGKALEYIGAPDGALTITVPLSTFDSQVGKPFNPCPVDFDPCKPVDMLPVIKYAVDYIKNYKVMGVPFTEYADVMPVIKLANLDKTGVNDITFFTLQVCDTGDKGALALVQQQYNDLQVIRTKRVGAISTYQVAVLGTPTAQTPAPFVQSVAGVIKGCKTCPTNYTEVKGGFIYAVSLEDEGTDKSSVIEGLPNAVAGTAKKAKGQDAGLGFYTVVLSKKLEDAAFATFVEANPTATVEFVAKVADFCVNGSTTSINWVKGDTCKSTTQEYIITVPDNECGESRLADLQAFYPNLVITETGVKGGCQSQYKTSTATNFTCEECDPIYKDLFKSEAPAPFDNISWEKNFNDISGEGGLYGIRLRGKKFKLASGECLRDQIGYTEDSVKIRATGGYVVDDIINTSGGIVQDTPYKVTYLSYYKPRTHVYGNDLLEEKANRTFFTGFNFQHDYMGRVLTGTESNLINLDAQYADYAITLRRNIYAQGLSQRVEENITYHFKVDIGRHEGVEDLLNSLATAAGIEPVQAYVTEPGTTP